MVRRKLLTMAGDIELNMFDLSDLLYEAQENKYFLDWGFESLVEYAKLELGIKPRKAQYLARIKRVCLAAGVKREDYMPAKVSKLRIITRLDPTGFFFNRETKANEPLVEHIARLIAEAPDMDLEELEVEVRRLQGQTGENIPIVRSYSTTPSVWDNVIKPAYEKARRRLGSKGEDVEGRAVEYSDGACQEVICAEFNADPNNDLEPDESQVQVDIPMEEPQI